MSVVPKFRNFWLIKYDSDLETCVNAVGTVLGSMNTKHKLRPWVLKSQRLGLHSWLHHFVSKILNIYSKSKKASKNPLLKIFSLTHTQSKKKSDGIFLPLPLSELIGHSLYPQI